MKFLFLFLFLLMGCASGYYTNNGEWVETNVGILSRPLFSKPIQSKYRVSSEFGPRWGRIHRGIDLAAPKDTPVNSSVPGFVCKVGFGRAYGKWVEVCHYRYGFKTRYAHLSKINVKKGDLVWRHTIIGLVGSTGRSTGNHLHFEIIDVKGKKINPRKYINF